MKLNELSPATGSVKNRKRLGRGVGSGHGKTSGKGHKGLKARSGGSVSPGFEGGQMPIHRRLPKRGFTNTFKTIYALVNLKNLTGFEDGATIDKEVLVQRGIVKGRFDGIKILGTGDVKGAYTIKSCKVSQSAQEKIEAAGGKVEA